MNLRERRIIDRMGRCVHFTGLWGPGMKKHEICAAGIRYDDVTIRHEPVAYTSDNGMQYKTGRSVPCLSGPGHNCMGATCAQRQRPTREQVEAEIARDDAAVDRVMKAFQAVVAHGQDRGTIVCPNCGGELTYGRASNGHYSAKCSTEGCVAWIQ